MSIFRAPERRNWTFEPPIPPNSGFSNGFNRVDLTHAESALQKIAVWACVNLVRTIAETLPLDIYEGVGKDRKSVPMPKTLLNLGGDSYGLADWCSQAVYSGMLRGNVVGLVADRQSVSGAAGTIVLQHPDVVSVRRDGDTGKPEWRVEGKIVDPQTIWHKRVNSVPGMILGLSPIATHALTIGTGIAAMRFGSQWFEDGAHPSGLLTTEKNLQQGGADTAKQRFIAALRGKREPLVLGNGWKYQQIQIAPAESQFLETGKYTGAECCRIFGPALAEVLGYDTGGALTYHNIEQRSLDLLTYAADPWLVRVERWLNELLPGPQYAKFNRAALIKTDLLAKYQAYEVALRNRWVSANEVRDLEDLKPAPWGDDPNFSTYTFRESITHSDTHEPPGFPPEFGPGPNGLPLNPAKGS